MILTTFMWEKLKENYLVLITLLVGLFTLFYGLGSHYQKLVSDEWSFMLNADILRGESYYPYLILPKGLGTTHTLLPYLMQPALAIFGFTTLGIRFVPALFGLLGILVFYFLVKSLANNHRSALIAATLLALTHWYIAISRVAIELSEILFFTILNLYCLSLFLNSDSSTLKIGNFKVKKKYIFMLLTGLTFGLVQHTYQSARVYLLFYVLFFPMYWWLKKIHFKEMFIYLVLFSVGFIITLSPLIFAYLQHPESFDSRRGELVFYQNLNLKDLIWSLKESTFRTLGMFHFKGSDVSCYNVPLRPMLDPYSGLFMIAGFLLAFKRFKKELNLVLILFFFVSLLPSVISYWPATPHGLRAAGAIIPTIVWVGLGIEKSSQLFKKYGWVFIIFAVLVIGYLNLKTYFVDQASLQTDCFRIDASEYLERKEQFLKFTEGVKYIR